MVFVMRGPRGGIIEATVSTTIEAAQSKAQDHLYDTADWAKEHLCVFGGLGFIRERRRRGFRVCKARLTVMAQLEE